MMKDHRGGLWISTIEGVHRFNGQQFQKYLSTFSGVDAPYVFLAEDENRKVWACQRTDEHSLSFIILNPHTKDTVSFESYTGVSQPTIVDAQHLFRTPAGIYIFSPEGVWRYDDKLEKVADYVATRGEKYFPKQNTYRTLNNLDTVIMLEANGFFRLPDKGLVLGSGNGLWQIDSLQGTFSRVALSDTAVYFAHQAQGQFWLGTQYGLYHWNSKTLHSFQNPHAKGNTPLKTFHLAEGAESQFWIATDQGLLQWCQEVHPTSYTPVRIGFLGADSMPYTPINMENYG